MNLGGQILLLASGAPPWGVCSSGLGWASHGDPAHPLEIRGQTLSLHGNGVKYEIPLENITDTQLLD